MENNQYRVCGDRLLIDKFAKLMACLFHLFQTYFLLIPSSFENSFRSHNVLHHRVLIVIWRISCNLFPQIKKINEIFSFSNRIHTCIFQLFEISYKQIPIFHIFCGWSYCQIITFISIFLFRENKIEYMFPFLICATMTIPKYIIY